MVYLTGFADEAAVDIDGQIKATKELGWEYIEARNINGVNIHNISDEDFDAIYGKLQDSGIKINCFGSAIANWAKPITEPVDSSIEETKRAIPRMQKLGTKIIRIMSFPVIDGNEPDDQMEDERFKRLRDILKMFNDAGLSPLHENCMNYGGMGWKYTLKLIENVPGLRLIFDTGNPVGSLDRNNPKAKPYPMQSSWEFYSHVKEHIAYVHIKDGYFDYKTGKAVYTYPNEGQGNVKLIVKDLLASGYDGGISIEPHMAVQAHDASITSEKDLMFKNYVEYGRRMEKIISKIKSDMG